MIRIVGIWGAFIILFVLTTALLPIDGYFANSIAAAISVLVCVITFKRRAHITILLPLFVTTIIFPITLLIAMGSGGVASSSIAFFQSLDFF